MPEHFDFLRRGLTLHNMACEAALVADNAVRMIGVSVTDSIALAYQLLEAFTC